MQSKPLATRPELLELLRKSAAAFDAMTPEQKRELRAAQRRSWVVGEMMLSNPNMSRAEAERIYHKVIP